MTKEVSHEGKIPATHIPPSQSVAEGVAAAWFDKLCNAVQIAAKKALPPKKDESVAQRKVSTQTKELFKQKRKLQSSPECVNDLLKDLGKKIKESCLHDFKKWVSDVVMEMEEADGKGDTRKIFHLVNKLSNKPKKPPTNLNSDADGKLLRSPEDIASAWESFLCNKFSATHEEHQRPSMPPLPKTFDPIKKREEFETAIKRLNLGKAPGPDGVPAIVYKH